MNTNVVPDTAVESLPQPVSQTEAPAAPAEVVPLPEVLRQIGRDSLDAPRRFLEETRVPFGGE